MSLNLFSSTISTNTSRFPAKVARHSAVASPILEDGRPPNQAVEFYLLREASPSGESKRDELCLGETVAGCE